MQYQQIDRTHFFRFDSLREMSEEVTNQATKDGRRGPPSTDPSWVGRAIYDYPTMNRMLNELWPEGMDIYSKMLDELRSERLPTPKTIRRQRAWSEECGDEIDIDRLRRNQPYWLTTQRHNRPGPLSVTIISDMTTSSSKSPESILWRGVASVLLTELLESAGYRIELWAACHATRSYYNNDPHASAVCLKRGSDPLDQSTLINAVSGWSFRTLFFGAFHLYTKSSVDSSYGHPTPLDPLLKEITPDEQLHVANQLWDRSASLSWVRTQLQKYIQ